jgi:hypothetical protein
MTRARTRETAAARRICEPRGRRRPGRGREVRARIFIDYGSFQLRAAWLASQLGFNRRGRGKFRGQGITCMLRVRLAGRPAALSARCGASSHVSAASGQGPHLISLNSNAISHNLACQFIPQSVWRLRDLDLQADRDGQKVLPPDSGSRNIPVASSVVWHSGDWRR